MLPQKISVFRIAICAALIFIAINPLSAEEKSSESRAYERWIWTELIAFDNQQDDYGVQQYLDKAGFTPTSICLLIGSPDFVLSHPGLEQDFPLYPEYCSREGHEFNRERKRQDWTSYQLRSLIKNLQKQGVQVFLSTFAKYTRDRTHREWISDHLEVLHVWKGYGKVWGLNCLARLNDGSYFEDYFASQMVKTLSDYGFDGWHGADGFGPLSGNIHLTSYSDDMIEQFQKASGLELPAIVTQECGYDADKLTARGDWILKHKRAEWSEFYADRWARFWSTMVDALHARQKQAVINSAWGRAPFESLYRYGIDYQRIAQTGVDGVIVETVAASLAMDPRLSAVDRHDDFLSMLMLMRAALPDTRLINLQTVHDVVEQWDAIHHHPTVLEREIQALANVFHIMPDGSLKPSSDGFLICLGDGLSREEWQWLQERWDLAFTQPPLHTDGVTVVWSDAAYRAQMADFIKTRSWNTHRLVAELMGAGATMQATINVKYLKQAKGAILVPNPHLLPAEELASVMQYQGGPIILIGRKVASLPSADFEFSDVYPPHELWCGVYGTGSETEITEVEIIQDEAETPLGDLTVITAPRSYWTHLTYRKVSPSFLKACAETLQQVSQAITVTSDQGAVALMPVKQADGRIRLAIKSRSLSYARPEIDVRKPIKSVKVLTDFPSVAIHPQGSKFSVRVPGRGIIVVEIELEEMKTAPVSTKGQKQ
ncbi:hypothetical protein [Gimesia maris]|uniref:Uncharacterized protein n=1 Tax=Gimesia maris TaxID=122 RepID=A0ABX5YQY7_9PLAN|nr:hypothetical protein [Gimesia maris]EDL59690.1 hypothetical protein PM8797T_24806 [Gimesia maris DSM 8797]QEG17952.1 hypothetical protein GmarT_38360 [Gimesia maris]QGQ29022.1 hypothetical protein F1729_10390 [Gimesia maris]